MNELLNFARKKKADRAFAKAGPGHVLGRKDSAPEPEKQKSISSKKTELELEKEAYLAALKESESFKPKIIEVEKPTPQIEILFWCPNLLGDSFINSYAEVDKKIDEHLASFKGEDACNASILRLVRNIEKSQFPSNYDHNDPGALSLVELRKKRFTFIQKIIQNLLNDPNNPKFRKLRKNNGIIRDLCCIEHFPEFLGIFNFKEEKVKVENPNQGEEEEEEVFVIPDSAEINTSKYEKYLETFSSVEPFIPELYRSTQVFKIGEMGRLHVGVDDLSDDFFTLSKDHFKKIMNENKIRATQEDMLLTSALREKLRIREIRNYKFSLIRVHTPGDYYLQSIFCANDDVSQIIQWVSSCLRDPSVSYLLFAPPGTIKTDVRKSSATRVDIKTVSGKIAELGLAPCCMLNLYIPGYVKGHVLREEILPK